MFVPRQLAIRKPSLTSRASANSTKRSSSPCSRPGPIVPESASTDDRPPKRVRVERDNSPALPSLSLDYAVEIVKCLELLFSTYFTHHVNPQWLLRRMRTVDGHNDYVHFSALLQNHIFQTIKPHPTQKTVVTALQLCPSPMLEVSPDGYHVHRRIPLEISGSEKSKEAWESSTIYVEPNIKGNSLGPGKIASVLTASNPNLSIEWVEGGRTACAFIILSEDINQQDIDSCETWPPQWIVMAKKEWRKRNEHHHKLNETPYQQISIPPKPPQADHTPYLQGIIIYLCHLHPDTTKSNIQSFLSRAVHKYTIKKLRKMNSSKKSDDKLPMARDFSIDYVDYKPKMGFETAHVRVKHSEDAKLLVRALNKRRRRMKSGDDCKGVKCRRDDDTWVKGTVITGERERAYWEAVSNAKGRK